MNPKKSQPKPINFKPAPAPVKKPCNCGKKKTK
jgi:hypothetical protein